MGACCARRCQKPPAQEVNIQITVMDVDRAANAATNDEEDGMPIKDVIVKPVQKLTVKIDEGCASGALGCGSGALGCGSGALVKTYTTRSEMSARPLFSAKSELSARPMFSAKSNMSGTRTQILSSDDLEGANKRFETYRSQQSIPVASTSSSPFLAKKTTSRPHIKLADLTNIGLLGCGGFGTVDLVEDNNTHLTYALKAVSKGYVAQEEMFLDVKREKEVMFLAKSPFIVKLYDTYNSPQFLYFLMEAGLGGELYTIYEKQQLHGREDLAKFYSAGVIEAFVHLHERSIVYRDIKTENLLLDGKGYPKLTDMGIAKNVSLGRTYTMVGTRDYFAPEVMQNTGQTVALDWWGLGILIFELMTGTTPFKGASPKETFQNLGEGVEYITYPPACQFSTRAVMESLLIAEPLERLPMLEGGVENLRTHEWYRSFDWKAFRELSMEAPYKVSVKHNKDISNFFPNKWNLPEYVKYVDDGSDWDDDWATTPND